MKSMSLLCAAALATTTVTSRAVDATEIYTKTCAKCHGADGRGDTKMGKKLGAKDYTDPKVQEALKDDSALKSIKEGLKDKEDRVLMKPAEELSDEDIKGLVARIRSFKK